MSEPKILNLDHLVADQFLGGVELMDTRYDYVDARKWSTFERKRSMWLWERIREFLLSDSEPTQDECDRYDEWVQESLAMILPTMPEEVRKGLPSEAGHGVVLDFLTRRAAATTQEAKEIVEAATVTESQPTSITAASSPASKRSTAATRKAG